MSSFWTNDNSRDGWLSPAPTQLFPEALSPKEPTPPPVAYSTQNEVILLEYYKKENARLAEHVKALEKQIEFLNATVWQARHEHELDYQLWVLRGGEKTPTPPPHSLPVTPRGIGYKNLVEKVNSTFKRPAWAGPHRKTPTRAVEEDDISSDPEMEATLLRLLEEGQRSAVAKIGV